MASMTNPNEYTFTVRGGRMLIEGKGHEPDFLSIRMGRRDALNLISQIASQLRYDIEDVVTVSFMGQMGRRI